MPQVIVIIVTYNGVKWIEKCLNSLLLSQYPFKTIIIDNASTDDTVRFIQEHPLKTQLIKSNENLGFGKANNIGLKIALEESADYVFLLNQDAYIFPETISSLVEIHQKYPEYGIISPLQYAAGMDSLDAAFRSYIKKNHAQTSIQEIEDESKQKPDILSVRFVNAAAWFISSSCLKKVGLFHRFFYHYGEDNNYSSRTQFHGFKVGITPKSRVIHDRSLSPPKNIKILKRKITLEPLYILMDLRKPFLLAVFLANWKLINYTVKGIKRKEKLLISLSGKRFLWMIKNLTNIYIERKNTKQDYIK